ncbi:hypothetical protein L7F22_039102 [Adiantum nelumboides]|nr:hypothetical protein [Adiantum nelumboides]
MRRDVNDSNRTSSSNETIDSIQAAFASLDAASSNSYEKSIQERQSSQWNDDNYDESRQTQLNSLRAQPRQSLINQLIEEDNDNALRPLAGGPTKGEMLIRAKESYQIFTEKQAQAHQVDRVQSEDRNDSPSSHFILSSPQPGQGVRISRIPEQRSTQNFQLENRTIDGGTNTDEESEREATIAVSSGLVEESSNKKRTLSWAEKRDRRNARRRASPPMTRRRAALVANEQTEDVMQPSIPSLTNVETSVDITDPSNNEKAIQDILQRGTTGRKVAKNIKPNHSRVVLPQLDMTLTEPDSPQQNDGNDHSINTAAVRLDNDSQSRMDNQSSDTESEGEGNEVRPTISSAISSGSNTEDENEMVVVHTNAAEGNGAVDETSRIRTRKGAIKRKPTVKQARKEPKKIARQLEIETGNNPTVIPVREKGQRKKSNKNLLKGRPLFEGLNFVIIGYWTKVRMYEKLIEKHAGTLLKALQPITDVSSPPLLPQFDHGHLPTTNPDRITHIVYCPHGTYTPEPGIVREAIYAWKKEKGREFDLRNIQVVDSRWISDCISNCLRKEDLLSVNEYRIVFQS